MEANVADPRDPFVDLRKPIVARRPRPDFTVALRRQLMEELQMSLIDDTVSTDHGTLRLVHLRVGDAEQAMRFFGSLFGWVGERYTDPDADAHVSYYTLNTAVTVRLIDDPASAPFRPNYAVDDVAAAARAIEAGGGRVSESELTDDGGGWLYADDDQGLPFVAYRPSDAYHGESAEPVSGDVGLVFMTVDAAAAGAFYGSVLGWELAAAHPGSHFYDAVDRVGVFDETAALGTDHPPAINVYFEVPALRPAAERIEELGGHSDGVPELTTMGPYFTVECTDDQGTPFGLISLALDPAGD
jgi:uncharacterized protein